jgi:hypothetical protein
MTDDTGYGLISKEIDGWLPLHKGESFDLDFVCRQLNIVHSQSRKWASVKLGNEVVAGRLEKSNKTYRYIDNDIVLINDWVTVESAPPICLQWPCSVDDQDDTSFGFENTIDIPQKGLIILAGVTNTGKSTFCRNFLWMNMDLMHCTYFSSETSKEDFAEYANKMRTWKNPFGCDGKPIFDLAMRDHDWHDVIRPNDINIVDWLNMGDKFYQLGEVLMKMKSKLDKGILVVSIQKDSQKELGMGGQWGEHLASLYITMDFGRLTVKKAKKWKGENPNGKTWGFDIVDRGTHFHHIRPLKKCGFCYQGKTKGNQPCDICGGSGWTEPD